MHSELVGRDADPPTGGGVLDARGSSAALNRAGLAAGTGAAFAVAFLFRFLTAHFLNDHFVHLSRAQQILFGDVPVRDFFDPGLVLQYYASAAALALSGHTLLGEAILTVFFVAAGAALTFLLATRLSGSFVAGTLATVFVVASFPRLYNYPKVFLYVLALHAAWRYAHRPGTGRIVTLAVVTAVAFLFRHDHAVWIGVSAVALAAVVHWNEPRRGLRFLGYYLAGTAALLLPFFVFIQLTVGVPEYFLGNPQQAQDLARIRINWLPIRIDRSVPLLRIDPPAGPRVNVRWVSDLDDAGRGEREARYGLTQPVHVEGTTWSYVAIDDRAETIAALIADPAATDTHNIDRRLNRIVVHETAWQVLERRVPLLRFSGMPGLLTQPNAMAWFYYVTFVTPLVSLIVLGVAARKRQMVRPDVAVVGMAVVLGFVIVQTLVRANPDARLPDVAGPVAVLLAWVTGRWLRSGATRRARRRRWKGFVASLLWLVTLWSVVAYAGTAAPVAQLLSGPVPLAARLGAVVRNLRQRPIDSLTQDRTGFRTLARYVSECTAPTDRVFVTWFLPEIFFYAERAFAGGQVYLYPGWHSSAADQRLTVERLEHERVPIVLSLAEGGDVQVDPDDPGVEFRKRFPIVYDYVHRRYRVAAESAFGGTRVHQILVDRRLAPSGTYGPLELPCYR